MTGGTIIMIIILNKKYAEKMEEILDELMTFLGILTKIKACL